MAERVLSLKGRRNDQPWFVIHAETDGEAKDALGSNFSAADEVFRNGGDLAQGVIAADFQWKSRLDKADSYYAEKALHDAGAVQAEPGGYDASGGGYSDAPAQQAPQQSRYDNQSSGGYQQQAPAQQAPQQRSYGAGAAAPSNAKHCKHGEMVYREGVSKKNNRPYKAFFCPSPQGTPDACGAEFVR